MGHEWKNRVVDTSGQNGVLRRVSGVSVRDSVRSHPWEIQSRHRCSFLWKGASLGGLGVSMPPGRLPREEFLAHPTGKRAQGGPRTRWKDFISSLAWEYSTSGSPSQSKPMSLGKRKSKALWWICWPYDLTLNKQMKMDVWIHLPRFPPFSAERKFTGDPHLWLPISPRRSCWKTVSHFVKKAMSKLSKFHKAILWKHFTNHNQNLIIIICLVPLDGHDVLKI